MDEAMLYALVAITMGIIFVLSIMPKSRRHR